MLRPGSILVLLKCGGRSGDSLGQMIYAGTRLDSGTVGEDQVTVRVKIDSGTVALKGKMRYYVDGSVYCGNPENSEDLDCSYDVRIINHKGDALVSNLQY